MDMKKSTIGSCEVTERLLQLSVTNRRSETPPPHSHCQTERIQSHQSSPSLMDLSPSRKENASPITQVQKQVRQCDLTPVTRNTGTNYVDEKRLVSPDDSLQHSGLSLPSGACFESTPRPPFPPRRSTSSACTIPIPNHSRSQSLQLLSELDADDLLDDEEGDYGLLVGEAIQLPSRQQFYSFNSRHEYRSQVNWVNHELASATPYQPSRQDLADVVGGMSREDLSSIFNARDLNPIPLEERQFSIPSIRMANHLNGSTTTYEDDEDDDEDDLSKDDASWSSRGSSLYLPDDQDNNHSTVSPQQVLKFTPTGSKPLVILEDLPFPKISLSSETSTTTTATTDAVVHHHHYHDQYQSTVRRSTSRKRKESHEKVYEWLRTVEQTGDNSIQEAASSKFLTRGMTSLSCGQNVLEASHGDDVLQETVFAKLRQQRNSNTGSNKKGMVRQMSLPPEVLQSSGARLLHASGLE